MAKIRLYTILFHPPDGGPGSPLGREVKLNPREVRSRVEELASVHATKDCWCKLKVGVSVVIRDVEHDPAKCDPVCTLAGMTGSDFCPTMAEVRS